MSKNRMSDIYRNGNQFDVVKGSGEYLRGICSVLDGTRKVEDDDLIQVIELARKIIASAAESMPPRLLISTLHSFADDADESIRNFLEGN